MVPPCRPDVKTDLAQRHRLNQSAAARCVTGRNHGYLAATATAVNMSCQTVADENKRTEKNSRFQTHRLANRNSCESHRHTSANGSWREGFWDSGILARFSRGQPGFRRPEKPESCFWVDMNQYDICSSSGTAASSLYHTYRCVSLLQNEPLQHKSPKH